MKKSYLFGMMAATMFFASSCQNDLDSTSLETSMVSFNLSTPVIASRAFSDGTMATKLQYAVYNEAGTELTALTKNNESITVGQTKNVKLQLTTGNTYSIIFWAANADAPYTVNFADKTMSVNYDNALSNAEVRDAFFARHTFEVKGNQTETIELKRPFAQLNIGTNDYAASKDAGYEVTLSSVTVPVYTTLNLFDGTVSDQETRTFGYAAIPTNERFPVGGYDYLSMNYLLVDAEQELVDVKFGYSDGTTPKTRTVGSVPVQRNHRTNIYGQLFTSDVDINVEINPAYETPDNDMELTNPTIVKSWAEFTAALAAGASYIKLAEDITYEGSRSYDLNKDVVVELNDKTFTTGNASTTWLNIKGSKATFKGGNIEGKVYVQKNGSVYSYATFENVTFGGTITFSSVTQGSLAVQGGNSVYAKKCTFKGKGSTTPNVVSLEGTSSGSVIFENCTFNSSMNRFYANPIGGTAIFKLLDCSFNKAAVVESSANLNLNNLVIDGSKKQNVNLYIGKSKESLTDEEKAILDYIKTKTSGTVYCNGVKY